MKRAEDDSPNTTPLNRVGPAVLPLVWKRIGCGVLWLQICSRCFSNVCSLKQHLKVTFDRPTVDQCLDSLATGKFLATGDMNKAGQSPATD
ncbi:hypothetical protein HPB47_021548 [Ixodes persulcatus]|uniref:Uncharacterized protein n=1 Tax=Ixodes persulcatus TaxID=34615 RepID=A0AC60QCG2_IXOPE|nr:hypothetical protein HPB47_021548 [Ixodes persulcatus]